MPERICDLKIIAKHLIIFNLKPLDTGSFPVRLLKLRKPVLSFCLCLSQAVDVLVKPFLNNAALPYCDRGFLAN